VPDAAAVRELFPSRSPVAQVNCVTAFIGANLLAAAVLLGELLAAALLTTSCPLP
jgi:hypothetical protein